MLSLLAVATLVSARYKTCTITYDDFNNANSNIEKLYVASDDSTIATDALRVTLESNYYSLTNQSGRILYNKSFTLWEGRNDTYSDRVASFDTSFLVTLEQMSRFATPGEGLTFVVAPGLNHPPNSFGGYLGLTNFTTDGNVSNQFIAIELDTFKEDFDPDSNHFIAVYMAQQNTSEDPTPPRPDTPILKSYLDLRGVVNQNSYFGFSASTGNSTEFNRVLRWNLTVEYYHDENCLKIALIVGIPTVLVLLSALVSLVYYFRRRWLWQQTDRQMSGKVKSMPGMPREYQYKELQKATNNFEETRKLGQGGYGVVYKGYLANQKDLEVAVKRFSRESLKGQDDFFQELTIINQLRHKNLVPLHGWCHNHGKLLLIYDYMPNGSLDKHLFGDANNNPLSWNLRRKIVTGVASALHYLHNEYQKKVVHRDVKASNIMLDAEFNAKLGDFGLARALDYEKTSYIEPEGVLGTRGPGAKIDPYPLLVDWVWALYREGQLLEAMDNRLEEDNVAEEVQRFLLLCLACSHPTASERPKTQEIVQMQSGSVLVPYVPSFRPAYMSPLPMWEEDTNDTTSLITPDCESSSAPGAINPEIQLASS
ncbi:hypothetical protein RHMOL_Rhmol10G0275600 [Rhododendron molle]|uniref:Uncharacterized protein n=1 Tax=Rhododendron molle TaxID=49168 RepID=A0ACC0M855_RHOML|nr:hypothetical protein RHMOL_Rhmol10G0275600 [Rhododendron molle]